MTAMTAARPTSVYRTGPESHVVSRVLGAAISLLVGAARHTAKTWALSIGVALGPHAGYLLSRVPGLSNYTDDKGNWTEPLGVVRLAVEAALLVVFAAVLARSRRVSR